MNVQPLLQVIDDLLAGLLAASPAAPQPGPNRTERAVPGTILCFYGHSGDGVRSGGFPDGVDRNLQFKIAAETIADTLAQVYVGDTVRVVQAWTKDVMLEELAEAGTPIRQVHVFCHGDADWLSLAYRYDRGARLAARVAKINASRGTEGDKALRTLREEDALVNGFLSRAVDPAQRQRIRDNHAPGASWHIWGCFAGDSPTSFTGDSGDAGMDAYFLRLNFGRASLDGIAVEIAKTFGVRCTGAQGDGLEFWVGRRAGDIVRATNRDPARKPFWLWLTSGSQWVTYDESGARTPDAEVFGRTRVAGDLPTPKPPAWLTDGYYAPLPLHF